MSTQRHIVEAQDANFLPSSALCIWPVTSQDVTSIPTNAQLSWSYAISSLTHIQKFTGTCPSPSAHSSSPLPLDSLHPHPLHFDELWDGNKVRKRVWECMKELCFVHGFLHSLWQHYKWLGWEWCAQSYHVPTLNHWLMACCLDSVYSSSWLTPPSSYNSPSVPSPSHMTPILNHCLYLLVVFIYLTPWETLCWCNSNLPSSLRCPTAISHWTVL